MKILIGKTSGFCAGVSYTVKKAEETLKTSNKNVYCLGEIVNNEFVIEILKSEGMIFVNSIDEVPILLFLNLPLEI